MGLQRIASRAKNSVLRIFRYLLLDVPRWLLMEWLPLWVGLIFPCATFFVISRFGWDAETTIRWTGMGLQLAGFITIILSLNGRWKSFKDFGILGAIRLRFSRFPRWKKKNVIVAVGAGDLAIFGGNVRAFVQSGEQATVEQRLSRIEQNLKSLDSEVGELGRSTKELYNELKVRLAAEAKERSQRDEHILDKMANTLTRGTHIEGLGVWFFMAGVVLATASKEISYFF